MAKLEEYYYGALLPLAVPAEGRKMIIESANLLKRFVDISDDKVLSQDSIKSVEGYLDKIAMRANESNLLAERTVLANALETWRYFLASKGLSIRNHIIYSRTDIFDDRLSDNAVANFAASSRKKTSKGLNVIYGIATRDSLDKTVPVLTERMTQHKSTKKYIKRRKNYLVHDEFNAVSAGDTVIAVEGRPLSKRKNFRLFAILSNKKCKL